MGVVFQFLDISFNLESLGLMFCYYICWVKTKLTGLYTKQSWIFNMVENSSPLPCAFISRANMGFLKIALDHLTKSSSAKTGDPH